MRRNIFTLALTAVTFLAAGTVQRAEAQTGAWGLSTGTAPWQGNNAHLTTQSGGMSVNDYFPNYAGSSYNNYARNLAVAASNTPSGTYPGYYCTPSFYPPGAVTVGPHASSSSSSSGGSSSGVSSGPRSR